MRIHQWFCHSLPAILIAFLFAVPTAAQSTNATVNGLVLDSSGALVADATVQIVNDATGVVYPSRTNGSGIYAVPNLPPGRYHIQVAKPGFKTLIKPDIVLNVLDAKAINFTLQVGAASETVTVEGGAPMVNTQDATVSTTIDRNFAENLPLNGRSFQTLILLTPGTVLPPLGSNGGTFSVNGQRENSNNFSVDGVSANLGGFLSGGNVAGQLNGGNPSATITGSTQGMVSVDALQEFKIQTSTYSPEFGRQPGGQISLLTRSGTNVFHGTASEYLRNTVLDANNWFNDRRGLRKGVDKQNDFGGTAGGPVFKSKTFFFFSYEGLRLLLPFTKTYVVPSTSLRMAAAPVLQNILNSWPLPDPGGNGSTYTLSESFPRNLDSYSFRIDQTLGKRTHLFGRFASTSSGAEFASSQAPNAIQSERLTERVLTIGTDMSIRSNLQNELRFNYSVNTSTIDFGLHLVGGAQSFDTTSLFPSPLAMGSDHASLTFSLPSFRGTLSSGSNGKASPRQINVVDNMTYSLGAHQIRWGMDYRRLFPIYGVPPLGIIYQITSMADLTNGDVSRVDLGSNLAPYPIYTNLSLYGQDTWRVSNRLNLTYGLRWELNPAPGERDGIQPLNVIGLNNPATATLAPLNSKLYKTTYNDLAPRVGIAYQIRQAQGREMIVRGGFGIFYDLNSETAAIGFGDIPFQNFSPTVSEVPFPVPSAALKVPSIPAPLSPPYSQIDAVDPGLKLPYTLQWNVSVEQGLGENQSFAASYVASAGRRLLRTDQLVDFNPDFTSISVVRNASSSSYQSLQLQFQRRMSQRLQALGSYTYSHSIDDASDAQVFYTASSSGNAFLNPTIDRGNSAFDMRHTFRAAVTYNVPTWDANFFSKVVLGKWTANAIVIAQTALPVDLIGGDYFPSSIPDGGVELRPNVVLGQPLYHYGSACTASNGGVPCPGGVRFNPTAFVPVAADANDNPTQPQGTLSRNLMRGFGAWQINLSVHRQFNITERVNLQFRSEFFNLFNHPNFSGINPFVGESTFGLAGNTLNNTLGGLNALYQIGGPRSIQLALKLSF